MLTTKYYLNLRNFGYVLHTLSLIFQIKQPDLSMVWLAVSEEGVTVLELASMSVIGRYALNSIGLFGGLQVPCIYITYVSYHRQIIVVQC